MSVTPGVVVAINGVSVPLSPKDYSDKAGAAISFELPRPVPLGTPAQMADLLSSAFGSSATMPDFSKLPSPLDSLAQRLASLNVTVEQFNLDISATKDAQGHDISPRAPNHYVVGLAGDWPGDPISILGDALQLKGVFLKVDYTTPTPTPSPPA
jgi:hypothetical protein